MDLGLLGLEAASLHILEAILKGVVYSIKLKLELAVLGKLVGLVGGSRHRSEHSFCMSSWKRRVGFVNTISTSQLPRGRKQRRDEEEIHLGCGDLRSMDVADFVDLSRLTVQDVTNPSLNAKNCINRDVSSCGHAGPMGRRQTTIDAEEYEFARFAHVDNIRTLCEYHG